MVPSGRLVGVDLARTLALVGMMATHLHPALDGSDSTLAQQLFGGRASALFAVLAGVSLALVTGRGTPVRGRERVATSVGIAVRAALIFGLGKWLADQESGIAIILQVYAALFVAMLPFLGWRPRQLAVLAAVWAVVAPFVLRWLTDGAWPDLDVAGWGIVTNVWIDGVYPGLVWLPYFWVGLAVGRLDLTGTKVPVRLAAGGAALAVVATNVADRLLQRPDVVDQLAVDLGTSNPEVVQRYLNHGLPGFVPEGSPWWLASVAPHSGTPFDLAQTIGSALAVVGLALLVARVAPRILAVAGGAGAMALTMYTAHVLMNTPDIWPADEPGSFPIHLALVLVVGAAFRLAGRRGPLEWLVSFLSSLAAKLTRTTVDHTLPTLAR